MFGSKTLKVLKPWFWLLNLILSLCYLCGLNFWMLDKPVVWGITCNSASREGIALAEWGLTSLALVITLLLPDCFIAMQFIKDLEHQPRKRKKKNKKATDAEFSNENGFIFLCPQVSLYKN